VSPARTIEGNTKIMFTHWRYVVFELKSKLMKIACLAIFTVYSVEAQDQSISRPWAPRDSVALRYVALFQGAPLNLGAGTPADRREPIVISPDGTAFFFVMRCGDMSSDMNVYELKVFRAVDVRKWLGQSNGQPTSPIEPWRKVFARSSSSVTAGISDARWDSESRAILYWGGDGRNQETLQVRRFDLRTGQIKVLTNYQDPALFGSWRWYDYANETLIYNGYAEREVVARYPMETFQTGRGEAVNSLRNRMRDEAIGGTATDLYVVYRGTKPRRLAAKVGGTPGGPEGAIAISPNGRHAVVRAAVSGSNHFVLADLEKNKISPLMNSPVGRQGIRLQDGSLQSLASPKAFWSSDSRRVILVNTQIPEGFAKGASKDETYIVEYDIKTRNWRIVTPMVILKDPKTSPQYVRRVDWTVPGGQMVVRHAGADKKMAATEYTMFAEGMTERSVDAGIEVPKPTLKGLEVTLRQNANQPPLIVASDGKIEGLLVETDRALDGVQIAAQQPFSWQENGKTITSGLTLPTGWNSKTRLPLVIQTYFYEPDLFLPDGANTTSDATQALAARGIAVLQIPTQPQGSASVQVDFLKSEGPEFSARIDAVVEALYQKGIIDTQRVGVTGFSRMGYRTYWTISHPGKTRLAASITADSWEGGYSSYLLSLGGEGAATSFENSGGKGAFWQNKDKWLIDAPSFNVDQVVTPALFTYNNSFGERDVYDPASYLIATYGAFLRNRKPMEMLLFPEGFHQLVRPRERLEMMTAVVDWYCFWLKGEIPPDPERAKRWERLRKMQEAVIAEQAAKGIKMAPLPPLVPAPSWVKPLPNLDALAPKARKAMKGR